jgi:hypothetical protein
MTEMIRLAPHTAAAKAAMLIYAEGPMDRAKLFSRVDFGSGSDTRKKTLVRAVLHGWLTVDDDKVDITAKAHVAVRGEVQETTKKFIPTPAAPRRVNLLHRDAYKPPKVFRRDDPEWAKRPDGFRFHTVA